MLLVQRPVAEQPVDPAPLVLHLAHHLAEAAVLDADQVVARHPHAVVHDLAEVAVAGHVGDGGDGHAGGAEVDDQLGQPGVRWRVGIGAGDEVAPVGVDRPARPDLRPRHDPVVAVALGPGADRGHVAAGVGLAHPDRPGRRAGDDVGQEAPALLRRAVLQERRADLAVGEPRRRHRCAARDQRLEHDEPLERRCARRRPPRPARSCRSSPARPARARTAGTSR